MSNNNRWLRLVVIWGTPLSLAASIGLGNFWLLAAWLVIVAAVLGALALQGRQA
ncbi:MAG: hypothetical protein JHC95_05540 [Solirubrobacteraceae bacterium]|nr:hypothetical protein [Solirubrobacteraceae bacterium]